jgi:hypothetical protein
MQPRELVLLVLLTGIVGFVGGQYSRASRATRQPAAASVETTAAAVQQGDTAAGTVPERTAQPAVPARDDALIRTQIRDGAPGTYIDAMLLEDERLLTRWPDRRLNALRVWIDREPRVAGWDPQYYTAAARAFEEWRTAGFPVAMDVVLNPSNVDIRIVWTEQFPAADGDQIGVTSKRRDANGFIVSVEITIAIHDKDGIAIPSENIFGVARHEAGHALGLGHSTNPNDVMFPFSRATVISDADRSTLHLLYKLPPGVVK